MTIGMPVTTESIPVTSNEQNKNRGPAVMDAARIRMNGRCCLSVVVPLALVWSVGATGAPVAGRDGNDAERPVSGIPADRRPVVVDETDAASPASTPTGNDSGNPEGANRGAADAGSSATFATQDGARYANPAPVSSAPPPSDTRPIRTGGPQPFATTPPANRGGSTLGDLTGGGFGGGRGAVRGGRGFGFAPGYGGGCGYSVGYAPLADRTSASASVLSPPRTPARAQRNFIHASVTGSETYSDNINLSENDKQSDFVTSVAPRLDACTTTGRIQGEASYQLQGVVYANNSSYDDIYNDLEGSTTINLIERHFYLDADTRYGQQVIDPAFGYGRSNIIRPDENQTTSWRTNISPYLTQDLGPVGNGILRYRYGRAIYDDNDVPDTTVQSVYASVVSPDTAEPLSWQGNAVTQWVDTSGGDQQRFLGDLTDLLGDDVATPDYRDPNATRYFDTATLQLGYRVLPHIQLTALGGVEDRYQDDGRNDRWSAPRWQVGVRYANVATTFEFDYGHRFYGASYALSATHSTALADFSLSYQEDPSNSGLDALDGSSGTFGAIGSIDSVLGYGGGLGGNDYGGYGNSLFNRNVYINKQWNATARFNTALTDTNIHGFIQKREAIVDDVPSTNYHGVDIDTRYALRPRISVVPSARWTHYEGDLLGLGTSNEYEAGVSVVRAVSPSAQAAIGYSRDWREGSVDYQENRITLQFRKSF